MLSACILPIIESMKWLLPALVLFISSINSSFAADEEAPAPAENTSASSAAASPPAIPRTEPDPEASLLKELITKHDPITQVLQLTTSKEAEKLIGYYLPAAAPSPLGGIILFPDEQTHMDWPHKYRILREGLADYGWHTLSVYLPRRAEPPIPKRTLPALQAIKPVAETAPSEIASAAESTMPQPESPATNQTAEGTVPKDEEPTIDKPETEPYREQVFRLGNSATEYLQQQEVERFIIIGVGTGAAWAAQYVEKFQESLDLRLIMIDARTPSGEEVPDLLALLPEIESTILDFHHNTKGASSLLQPHEAPKYRLRTARQNGLKNFYQIRLPAHSTNEALLLKQVRGQIKRHFIQGEAAAQPTPENNTPNSSTKEKAPG